MDAIVHYLFISWRTNSNVTVFVRYNNEIERNSSVIAFRYRGEYRKLLASVESFAKTFFHPPSRHAERDL